MDSFIPSFRTMQFQELAYSDSTMATTDDLELCSYVRERTEIVVLGASGDLAKKKTFPALLDLFVHDFLPQFVSS